MNGSFTANLFEILVYLIPGILLSFAIFFWKKELFNDFNKKYAINNSLLVGLYLSISFLLGTVNHQVSRVFQPLQYLIGSLNIENVSNKFPDINLVKLRVSSQLNDSTIGRKTVSYYRYCLTYDRENSKGNMIQRIDRLSALSTFCLNLLIPVLLLTFLIIKESFNTNSCFTNILYILIFLIIEISLFIASFKYFNAMVLEAYRLFLVLSN